MTAISNIIIRILFALSGGYEQESLDISLLNNIVKVR